MTIFWQFPVGNPPSRLPSSFSGEKEFKLVYTKMVYFSTPKLVQQIHIDRNVKTLILSPSVLGTMSVAKSAYVLPFTSSQKEAFVLHDQFVSLDFTGPGNLWVGSNLADSWVNIYGYGL